MTPKEKAENLLYEFRFSSSAYSSYSFLGNEIPETILLRLKDMHVKECALRVVDEMLNSKVWYFDDKSAYVKYWKEVKQEIEKL